MKENQHLAVICVIMVGMVVSTGMFILGIMAYIAYVLSYFEELPVDTLGNIDMT